MLPPLPLQAQMLSKFQYLANSALWIHTLRPPNRRHDPPVSQAQESPTQIRSAPCQKEWFQSQSIWHKASWSPSESIQKDLEQKRKFHCNRNIHLIKTEHKEECERCQELLLRCQSKLLTSTCGVVHYGRNNYMGKCPRGFSPDC